jgi:hypothetical protein
MLHNKAVSGEREFEKKLNAQMISRHDLLKEREGACVVECSRRKWAKPQEPVTMLCCEPVNIKCHSECT